MVHAEKAFFAARVRRWSRNKVQTEPDFNLQTYLTMLMYYKTDVADLKFSKNEDKLLYKMKNNDKEVQELVDSLIKSSRKPVSKKDPSTTDKVGDQTDADGSEDFLSVINI